MRLWMECLLSVPGACDDFIAWAQGAEKDLHVKLTEAVREDRLQDAKSIAHEIEVYEGIRKVLRAEMRERTAQAQYDQKMKGGNQ